MGLQSELTMRSMRLRLKLAAFKKVHGEYPDQLNDVDFGIDAIDPYTGTEFGYRRQGFQFPIVVKSGATSAAEIVKAGQAILWSAGPFNVRRFVPVAADNEQPDDMDRRINRLRRMDRIASGITSAQALVFTLP